MLLYKLGEIGMGDLSKALGLESDSQFLASLRSSYVHILVRVFIQIGVFPLLAKALPSVLGCPCSSAL
jgi:hypothetical protein